jgi:hypothetical protein
MSLPWGRAWLVLLARGLRYWLVSFAHVSAWPVCCSTCVMFSTIERCRVAHGLHMGTGDLRTWMLHGCCTVAKNLMFIVPHCLESGLLGYQRPAGLPTGLCLFQNQKHTPPPPPLPLVRNRDNIVPLHEVCCFRADTSLQWLTWYHAVSQQP